MKTRGIMFVLLAIGVLLTASCTTTKTVKMVPEPDVKDLTAAFRSGELISKVDGLVILLDASSSMAGTYQDYRKFDIAKTFVHHMNETMPPIPAISGLRTFGHAPELSDAQSELFFGMRPYNRNEMKMGLAKVNPSGGPTPMAAALKGAGADLENVNGRKAIVVVSDGKDLTDLPAAVAGDLVKKMGDTLCIYTVMIGDDEKGKVLLEKMAAASPCGFMALARDLSSAAPMAGYVADVFLTKADKKIRTPEKEIGLGYHKPEPLLPSLEIVHFEFDSSDLTAEGKKLLEEHIRILKEQSDIKIIVNGHTSARGSRAYNQALSERRASSVRDYFIHVGNIRSGRITAIGHGETKPAVHEPNPEIKDSMEAKTNMRVVFDILAD